MEKELIQKCIKNDRKAQETFYKLCYSKFIGTAFRYSKNKEQAIEFFNHGFVKILMNLKKYELEKPFDFWAKRVLINEILNELKKEKNIYEKEVYLPDNHDFIQESSNDDEYLVEKIDLIKQNINTLPPMTKKVFNLYIDGYKHHEIASMLNMNENTSMWHYSEAKKRIKSNLLKTTQL